MAKLTEKQANVLAYIQGYIDENGYAPTFEEIKATFGFKSSGTVADYIEVLKQKGKITLERNKKRAINVTEDLGHPIRKLFLLGTINAGYPSETFDGHEETVEIAQSFFPSSSQEYFALKVNGKSMVEKSIDDKDIIICRKQDTASDGDIVVANIEGERTLKELKVHRDQLHQIQKIELIPYNRSMNSIWVESFQDFKVEGIFFALIRKASFA